MCDDQPNEVLTPLVEKDQQEKRAMLAILIGLAGIVGMLFLGHSVSPDAPNEE